MSRNFFVYGVLPMQKPPINKPIVPTTSTANALSGPEGKFLDKLASDWKYNAPSDNLWTVDFHLHNADIALLGNVSINHLYDNINSVNYNYDTMFGTNWNVKLLGQSLASSNNAIAKSMLGEYFGGFTDDLGVFLCQGVSFPGIAITYGFNTMGEISQHTGFHRPGQYVNSRTHTPTFTMQFLETNFSLKDIFFDKWAAAIAQQGLIEDDTLPMIKADMYLKQYACGVPGNSGKEWVLRKQIKAVKCYPVNIEQGELRSGYELDRAGSYKVFTVTMAYDEAIVNYLVATQRGIKNTETSAPETVPIEVPETQTQPIKVTAYKDGYK